MQIFNRTGVSNVFPRNKFQAWFSGLGNEFTLALLTLYKLVN